MAEKTYKVKGMSCGHCVMHVKNAVEELVGVENCDVNLPNESMTVRFDDSKINFTDFKAAVEEAGYGLEE
jgi:copper chaperone